LPGPFVGDDHGFGRNAVVVLEEAAKRAALDLQSRIVSWSVSV